MPTLQVPTGWFPVNGSASLDHPEPSAEFFGWQRTCSETRLVFPLGLRQAVNEPRFRNTNKKTSLLRNRPNGMRSSLPTFARANPHSINARGIETRRRRRSCGRSGRSLLFTMSDNTQQPGSTRAQAVRNRLFLSGRMGCSDVSTNDSRASVITTWWSQTGSNRRPPACKAGALPTELWPRRERS